MTTQKEDFELWLRTIKETQLTTRKFVQLQESLLRKRDLTTNDKNIEKLNELLKVAEAMSIFSIRQSEILNGIRPKGVKSVNTTT